MFIYLEIWESLVFVCSQFLMFRIVLSWCLFQVGLVSLVSSFMTFKSLKKFRRWACRAFTCYFNVPCNRIRIWTDLYESLPKFNPNTRNPVHNHLVYLISVILHHDILQFSFKSKNVKKFKSAGSKINEIDQANSKNSIL